MYFLTVNKNAVMPLKNNKMTRVWNIIVEDFYDKICCVKKLIFCFLKIWKQLATWLLSYRSDKITLEIWYDRISMVVDYKSGAIFQFLFFVRNVGLTWNLVYKIIKVFESRWLRIWYWFWFPHSRSLGNT